MNKSLALAAGFVALSVAALAAPLSETTAILARPEQGAPIVGVLKAGTEPAAASDSNPTPSGWLAVEVPGDVLGFVLDKDFTKQLDVKPGVNIRTEPRADAPVLEVMQKGLKCEIKGVHGRWWEVKLPGKIGYVYLGPSALPAAPAALPPESTTPAMAGAPAPAEAAASGPAPAPIGTAVVIGQDAASLPRFFQGVFVSTRHALSPRRPYDWALNDDHNERVAYLDVSSLLLTEQIDKYVSHEVVVFGGASAVPGTKDIVIKIESLQLR